MKYPPIKHVIIEAHNVIAKRLHDSSMLLVTIMAELIISTETSKQGKITLLIYRNTGKLHFVCA